MEHARRWLAAWVVLAVAIAGGSISLAGEDDSPDEVLHRIRAFVDAHPTVRFQVDAQGGESSRGEVAGDRVRTRTAYRQGLSESIAEGGTTWSRFTPEGDDPDPWLRTSVDDVRPEPRSGVSVSVMVFISFAVPGREPPSALLAAFERAGRWELIDDGTLRSSAPARDLLDPEQVAELESFAEGTQSSNVEEVLDAVHTVTLEHADDGRLVAIIDEVDGRRATTRFFDWGADVAIELPDGDEVETLAELRRRAGALSG